MKQSRYRLPNAAAGHQPKTITHSENESVPEEAEDVQNYWQLCLGTNSTKMSDYMREKNIVDKEKK